MTSLNRKPVVPDRRMDAVPDGLPCGFCRHANPSDSRYCNRCGAPLAATPCPRCGTISDAGARACKTCGADLGDRGSDTLFQPLPPSFKPGSTAPVVNLKMPEPVPSWDTPMFILDDPVPDAPSGKGTAPRRGDAPAEQKPSTGGMSKLAIGAAAFLAVLAVIGILVSRHDARDEAPRPAAASGGVTVAPAPSEPASPPAATQKVETPPPSAAPARTSAAPVQAAPRNPTEAAPPPPRPLAGAAPPSAPSTSRIGPCTEAVAALGLCTPPASPAKEP